MGKMSDLHLALQEIQSLCNNAPSPHCLHRDAHKVINNFENRIRLILRYVKDIENTLSGGPDTSFNDDFEDAMRDIFPGSGDAKLPGEKARP